MTITELGGVLYAVNVRFDVTSPAFFGNPPTDPSLDYNLVRVELPD